MKNRFTTRRILIVDDEVENVDLLKRILAKAGFIEVEGIADPRRALSQFREFQPDILLLDLHMPHLDGFDVLRQVRNRVGESEYFPTLVISGDLSSGAKQRALTAGAKDFLEKPYDNVEVVLRVMNLLEARDLNQRLEERVQERTKQVRVAQVAVAERLALAAELRDYQRGLHTHRVGRTAASIADVLGLDHETVEVIRQAAPLHDIGKIGIPDSILLKPGSLSLEEWDILKTHTTLGASILSGSDSPIMQMAEEIALYHHENWDGTGYTPGLAGEEIPLSGRIAALADVFDALIQDRPYKSEWPLKDAVEWIASQRGRKFDPSVVDAFLETDPMNPLPLLEGAPALSNVVAPIQSNFKAQREAEPADSAVDSVDAPPEFL